MSYDKHFKKMKSGASGNGPAQTSAKKQRPQPKQKKQIKTKKPLGSGPCPLGEFPWDISVTIRHYYGRSRTQPYTG